MTALHLVAGVGVMTLFSLAGLLGAWRWWRVEASRWFWRLLRAAQAMLGVQVVLGGILLVQGREPSDGLHLVYGLLPVAVSFVAEQLRIAAAQTVLDARGLADARAVGALPEADQRSVVVAILRRELGVMTLAALFIAGLAARAGFMSGAL
jgi:hypothetical protein